VKRATFYRWTAFNLVGLGGVGVQLIVLTALTHAGVHYLPATALAVEAAVLNNFAWHQHWTWVDRPGRDASETLYRLIRFNLSVGALSIAQNLVFMKILVGYYAVPFLAANLLTITLCSLLNFFVSDHVVFRKSGGAD
jgi:dolichol-phosphate mannosyltransferase